MTDAKKVATSVEGEAPSELLDLSLVEDRSPHLKGPKMTIHKGKVAVSTVEGADEAKAAATKQNLESPLPASLMLVDAPGEGRAVFGVPSMTDNPAHLRLDWIHQGQLFRCNLRKLLKLKKITIPARTRMVINIGQATHPKHGPCLKFWWDEDCFEPVTSRPRKNKEEEKKAESQEEAKEA